MSITVLKLTIECIDEQGNKFKRILEGQDANEWYQNNIKFCEEAEKVGMNYKWHELNWKQFNSKDKPKKIYRDAVLLTDILEKEYEK